MGGPAARRTPVRPIPELRRGSRPTGLPPGPPRWAVSARRDLFAAAGIPGVVGVLREAVGEGGLAELECGAAC